MGIVSSASRILLDERAFPMSFTLDLKFELGHCSLARSGSRGFLSYIAFVKSRIQSMVASFFIAWRGTLALVAAGCCLSAGQSSVPAILDTRKQISPNTTSMMPCLKFTMRRIHFSTRVSPFRSLPVEQADVRFPSESVYHSPRPTRIQSAVLPSTASITSMSKFPLPT